MKKIVYLHGLETPPGGEKVGFLSQQGYVYAPAMNYKDKNSILEVVNNIMSFKPDVIVGSSIGGALAYKIAEEMEVKIIVFNPALHSSSIKLPHIKFHNNYSGLVKGLCVLGMKDTVINPNLTLEILKDEQLKFIKLEEMAHRVPFDIFINIYNKYSDSLYI